MADKSQDTPPVPPSAREKELSERLGKIIEEHGGLVSNIPARKDHEYWQVKAELDALRNSA